MRIEVDMSDYIPEEVLSMECEDRQWRSMVYLSKSHETEKNYKIYNKGILVVIKKLENWRHLLEGA